MITEAHLAYLAGIVDGEGHVCVKPTDLRIVLCMADVQILEWCHHVFGGSLSGEYLPQGNSRPRRMWSISRKSGLEAVLRGLMPFLVLKRLEAAIMLEAIEHGKHRPGPNSTLFGAWKEERRIICERAHEAMLARKR